MENKLKIGQNPEMEKNVSYTKTNNEKLQLLDRTDRKLIKDTARKNVQKRTTETPHLKIPSIRKPTVTSSNSTVIMDVDTNTCQSELRKKEDESVNIPEDSTQRNITEYSVPITNKFDILNNNQTDTDYSKMTFLSELKRKNNDNPANTALTNSGAKRIRRDTEIPQREISKESQKKANDNFKPPPFNILYQDPKDTVNLLKNELGEAKFFIKRINNNKHILQLDNLENYKKNSKILRISKHKVLYLHAQRE